MAAFFYFRVNIFYREPEKRNCIQGMDVYDTFLADRFLPVLFHCILGPEGILCGE